MCLYKTKVFPLRAKEDIVVWKVVKYDKDFNTYNTLVISERIKIPGVLKSKTPILHGIFKDQIEGEGVHAYSWTETQAMHYFETREGYHCNIRYGIVSLVRCRIPKGALYYEAVNEPEIAASRLILDEVVCQRIPWIDIEVPKKINIKSKKHKKKWMRKRRKS